MAPVRLPGLDLLRAVAIVWVMGYHVASYGVRLPAVAGFGWMGVDLFFVLSGYLIGAQLLRPYACGGSPRWGQFFLRRAWRVLPAYLTVLALYAWLPALREAEAMRPLWQFFTFTLNLLPGDPAQRAFSHAWSLCVEEHFYLVLPALVWLLARRPRAAVVVALLLAALLGGMLLRAWLWQHAVAPAGALWMLRFIETIYNPTYTRLDGLLAGVALALVQTFRPAWWDWAMARGAWFLAVGAAAVLLAMGLCRDPMRAVGVVFGYPLLAGGFAALLVGAVSPRTWPGRWRVPGAAPIAAMAFSLYLTNKAVYHVVQALAGAWLAQSNWLGLCVHGGAALLVGAALYAGVERPALRWRARWLGAQAGQAAGVQVGQAAGEAGGAGEAAAVAAVARRSGTAR